MKGGAPYPMGVVIENLSHVVQLKPTIMEQYQHLPPIQNF